MLGVPVSGLKISHATSPSGKLRTTRRQTSNGDLPLLMASVAVQRISNVRNARGIANTKKGPKLSINHRFPCVRHSLISASPAVGPSSLPFWKMPGLSPLGCVVAKSEKFGPVPKWTEIPRYQMGCPQSKPKVLQCERCGYHEHSSLSEANRSTLPFLNSYTAHHYLRSRGVSWSSRSRQILWRRRV